jgi:hypothetical protein
MGSVATIAKDSISVQPGGEAECELRVRNTGRIVDIRLLPPLKLKKADDTSLCRRRYARHHIGFFLRTWPSKPASGDGQTEHRA